MHWLYNLPTWGLALLIVTGFVTLAEVGLILTHRRQSPTPEAAALDNSTVGWFFSAVALLYGLLLGLLTVAAWGSYNQATTIASQEASLTAELYRDSAAYPDSARDALRAQLHRYLTVVVTQSWPAQRRGLLPDSETVVLNQFQKLVLHQRNLGPEQLVVHGETIRAYNSLIDLRRQRQEAIQGGVPGILWLVVLVGAVATISFSYWFVVVSYRLHALLTGVVAGMVGLLVFLLVALDHPYWGEVSVSSDAYQLVLHTLITP